MLITGQWAAVSRTRAIAARTARRRSDHQLSFIAVLLDDDQAHTAEIVSVARAARGEALRLVQPLADEFAAGPAAHRAALALFIPLEWRHGTAVPFLFITEMLVAGGMKAMCSSCGDFSGLAMLNGLTSGRIREHRAPVACHGMVQNV